MQVARILWYRPQVPSSHQRVDTAAAAAAAAHENSVTRKHEICSEDTSIKTCNVPLWPTHGFQLQY